MTSTITILTLIALLLPFLYFRLFSHILYKLLISSTQHSCLNFSPNHLRPGHIILVILILLLKPLLRLLRLVPPLQPEATGDGFLLPEISLVADLQINKDDLPIYERAIPTPHHPSTTSAKTPLFFLPGLTTPLMLLLLAQRTCPILPLGSVNVRNRFEWLMPARCTQALSLHSPYARASLLPHGRRVKRGVEVDIEVEVIDGGNQRSEERDVIFRQTITVLQFLSPSVRPRGKAPATSTAEEDAEPDFSKHAQPLVVEHDAPSQWAAFCKDYNPIHISSLAAKLFGQADKVAHGNLIVARALDLLLSDPQALLGQEWCDVSSNRRGRWLEASFKRPMVVPTKLDLLTGQSLSQSQDGGRFRIAQGEKVHIEACAGWLD